MAPSRSWSVPATTYCLTAVQVLLLALVAYVGAAVCALMANRSQGASAADAEVLQGFASDAWGNDGWDQQVAILLSKYLVSLRRMNETAAKWLTWAIALEIGGTTATALLGLIIVNHVT